MKQVLVAWVLLFATPLLADEGKQRIAIFDPTSSGTSIDEGTKIAIREIISSTIVNTGTHEIVERSLLEKVMEEQAFSNSGIVDDKDATQIGKLAGANKVIVSVVTLTGGRNMLSIKMIDVTTASVERQQVKVVTSGELLDVIEPMTLSMIGGSNNGSGISIVTASQAEKNDQTAVAAKSISPEQVSDFLRPKANEVVLYLQPTPTPKEKEQSKQLELRLDKEVVGTFTPETGFVLRLPIRKTGTHTLKVSGLYNKPVYIYTDQHNLVQFTLVRWSYLGKAFFTIAVAEQAEVSIQ